MRKNYIWYLIIFIILAEFSTGSNRITMFLHDPLLAVTVLGSILVALTVHEFAHAWMADRLGDPNPRLAGRVSLNPAAHLDPYGTLLIILTGYGWGKPVRFDPFNLDHPDQDGAVIAAAGPVSNLLMAVIAGILMHIPVIEFSYLGTYICFIFFQINVNLAVFNLLPIFPLDGHHILRAFLPTPTRCQYDAFNRSVGIFLAIVLMLPLFGGRSIVSYFIDPATNFAYSLLVSL